jgi:hypothetical protein
LEPPANDRASAVLDDHAPVLAGHRGANRALDQSLDKITFFKIG